MENLERKYRIIRARGQNNLILEVLVELSVEFTDPNIKQKISDPPFSRVKVVFNESDNVSSDISYQELIDLCIQKIDIDNTHFAEENIKKIKEEINNILNSTVYEKFEYAGLDKVKIQSIPKLYAKIVLIEEGLWPTIENYFSQENINLEHKVFFEDSQNWDRNNLLFKHIVNEVLQLSEEQIDDLFYKAYIIYKENNNNLSLNARGKYVFPFPFDNFR